ncbi:MAG TPA: hypothetical protein VEY91_10340, partial [Candidatus Limnocylindria bacterium]|nr:hypothetical protein [Candidatus Limnocylindria bacterium]
VRAELERLAVPLTDGDRAALDVVCVMSRLPLSAEELERLRARCRERPTALLGLQNDAFLEDVPEAALRVSTADGTPLTRRVLARTLAERLRAAASARA